MEESKLCKCLDMENINYHLLPQFTLKLKASIIFDSFLAPHSLSSSHKFLVIFKSLKFSVSFALSHCSSFRYNYFSLKLL